MDETCQPPTKRIKTQEDDEEDEVKLPVVVEQVLKPKKPEGIVRIAKKRQRGMRGETDMVVEGFLNIDATSGSGNKVKGAQVRYDFSPMFLGPVVEADLIRDLPVIRDVVIPQRLSLVDPPSEYTPLKAALFENYWQYGKIFQDLNHVVLTAEPSSSSSSSSSSASSVFHDQSLTEEQYKRSFKPSEAWKTFREKGYRKKKGDRHPDGTKTDRVKFIDDKGRRHFAYLTACSSFYFDQPMGYIESRKKIYVPIYAYLARKTQSFKNLRKMIQDGEVNVQIFDFDVPADGKSHIVTLDLMIQRINDPSVPFGHGNVIAALLAGIEPHEYCFPETITKAQQ